MARHLIFFITISLLFSFSAEASRKRKKRRRPVDQSQVGRHLELGNNQNLSLPGDPGYDEMRARLEGGLFGQALPDDTVERMLRESQTSAAQDAASSVAKNGRENTDPGQAAEESAPLTRRQRKALARQRARQQRETDNPEETEVEATPLGPHPATLRAKQKEAEPVPEPRFVQTEKNRVPGEAVVSASPLPDPSKAKQRQIPSGLPPALDGFLVLLLHLADIEDAPTYSDSDEKLSLGQKVSSFKAGVSLLLEVYGNPQGFREEWDKVASLDEFLAHTEPTRGHSGSVSGDMRRLWYYVNKMEQQQFDQIPHAFKVEMPNSGAGDFANETLNYEAQAYVYEVDQRMQSMLRATATQLPSGKSFSVMESVFRAFGTFLKNAPSTWGDLLRKTADVMEDTDYEIRKAAQSSGINESASVPEHLRKIAGYSDSIQRMGRVEETFIDFLRNVQNQDFAATAALIEAFETSLSDIVEALRSLGSSIIQSDHVRFVASNQDDKKHIYKLLEVLFNDYPKLLPAPIFKNIILDLFRSPDMSNDLDVLVVMLRHFGPILKNFLQTSSRFEAMNTLADTFESLQTAANKEVPFEVIEMIIREDPNNYALYDINPRPLATGKFFQAHMAKMKVDGVEKPVVARVMLPDSFIILKWELEILKRLAGPLSKIYLPATVTNPVAAERIMRKIIKSKHRNHVAELNIPLTVIHQNAARERFKAKAKEEMTSRGTIRLELDVPFAYPAMPGSTVMVCDAVEDIMDIKDLVREYPDIAELSANHVTQEFFDELIFRPLESHRGQPAPDRAEAIQFLRSLNPADGAVEYVLEHEPSVINAAHPNVGVAHNDLHGGNLLYTTHETAAGMTFEASLIDWGLTSWVLPEHIEQIAILGYGAEFNHATIITNSLLNLSSNKLLSKKEIFNLVRKKTEELEANRTWWSPEEWVTHYWTHGYLDFPPYVVALADSKGALFDLRKQLGFDDDEETEKFMSQLFSSRQGVVIRRAMSRHPWSAILSGKVALRYGKYTFLDCARKIAGKSRNVDPLGH